MSLRLCFSIILILLTGTPLPARDNPHEKLEQVTPFTTCLDCHEKTAHDVAQSVHYRFRGSRDGRGEGGVLAGYSPYAGGSAAVNWLREVKRGDGSVAHAGCALCHPGRGALPGKKPSMSDGGSVDCFICHGEGYRREVVRKGDGVLSIDPVAAQDFRLMASRMGKPSPSQCQRCHGDTGYGNRREGMNPTEGSDVHFAMGMLCTECHLTVGHRISGGGDLGAVEPSKKPVDCRSCHTIEPHPAGKGDDEARRNAVVYNGHAQKIACQTCHIPAVGRDPGRPTLVERDWTRPVRRGDGLFAPTDRTATEGRAEYFWWDGSFRGDGTPSGTPRDGTSRIYPWKRVVYRVPVDTMSGVPLDMDLGVYAETGSVDEAVKRGVARSGQSWSGKWKEGSVTEYLLLNHQVAPKEKALRCTSCHDPNGVLDFRKLRGAPRRR